MESNPTTLYVHLIPNSQSDIKESFKVTINSNSTIADLSAEISCYLDARNDGNKIYTILEIKSQQDGRALPTGRYVTSYFGSNAKTASLSSGSFAGSNDVFCILECSVDTAKHVKPISVTSVTEESKTQKSDTFSQKDVDKVIKSYDGKMKTLTTYSYYESSNGEWVKLIVSIDNIKSHPKDKINVIFTERTLDVFVKDFGSKHDEIQHFGCRKLHRYVIPEKCKWDVKSNGISISLKKKSLIKIFESNNFKIYKKLIYFSFLKFCICITYFLILKL